MNRSTYTDYFLKLQQATQRHYKALRAVFVNEEFMQDVAQRFGLTYGTIRNWVSEFRRACDAGEEPPFSFHHIAAVPHRTRVMM
jgi:DNA-directed RNA polymerase specialized sigma24 family protein